MKELRLTYNKEELEDLLEQRLTDEEFIGIVEGMELRDDIDEMYEKISEVILPYVSDELSNTRMELKELHLERDWFDEVDEDYEREQDFRLSEEEYARG